MPDDTTWLAKGTCAQCGRAIAARAHAPRPVDVTCNVCRAVTRVEPPASPTSTPLPAPPPPAPSLDPSRAARWSWPVVLAVVGGFFVAGLALSLILGGAGEETSDAPGPFPTSEDGGPAPTGAPPTPTTGTQRPVGEYARVYVNDTTGRPHEVTIEMWQGDAMRASTSVNTSAPAEGHQAQLDPQGASFELRVHGEAEGIVLVRAFDAPRCGTAYFEIELVIGEDSRFRWGNVGCGAVSSQR